MTTLILRTRADVHPEALRPAVVPTLSAGPIPQDTPQLALNPHTVQELLTCYAQECFPAKAPSTQKQYQIVFRALTRELGPMSLAELTPDVLRTWRQRLSTHYAPGTVRRWMDTFTAVLNFSVRDLEWLDTNPLHKVRKPPEGPGRTRFLSREELARLLRACQQSSCPYVHLVVELAVSTGARRQELQQLRWAEVDLERGVLRLMRTKNKTPRSVPIVGRALTMLQQHAIAPHRHPVWVFPRRDGQGGRRIEKPWYSARRRAGLEDFRFHDLRHTAASYLAMSGASLLEIAQILGHKTLRMTQRYSHLTDAHTAVVVQRMIHQFLTDDEAQEGAPDAQL